MTAPPLKDISVAISISDAPDMAKLGYPKKEVDRVLLTVCGTLIRAGARIAYGGNLDPYGYTFKIFRHLAKTYAVRSPLAPFVHYIPEAVLLQTPYPDIYEFLTQSNEVIEANIVQDGKPYGQIFAHENFHIGFRPHNSLEIRTFSEAEFSTLLKDILVTPTPEALTQMRALVSKNTDARVVMGGKMGIKNIPTDRYSGSMPGIVEEALYSLEHGKPTFILGAFGGAARDIAIALGLLSPEEKVPRGEQMDSYTKAISRLRDFQPSISANQKDAFRKLARLERAETIGYEIVRMLTKIMPRP